MVVANGEQTGHILVMMDAKINTTNPNSRRGRRWRWSGVLYGRRNLEIRLPVGGFFVMCGWWWGSGRGEVGTGQHSPCGLIAVEKGLLLWGVWVWDRGELSRW